MPLTPGIRLGPYEIVSALGAGGMGEVYRARDPRLGRDVAIKVLPASMADDPGRLSRFEQEARAIAALSHPNVLAIYDIGTAAPPYIVTELLEGETLRAVIVRGPLPAPTVISIGLQLASGLGAAHARGVIHRDLKPENVFLTQERVVKILDFGLAKTGVAVATPVDATRAFDTLPGLVIGTVGYMAPEQLRGEAVDPRADIFAFGAILYEMLTGVRAFAGPTPADTVTAVLREQPADLAGRSGVPASFARLVGRCLAKDARERFQSIGDVRFALESLGDAPAAAAPAPSEGKSIAVLPFANMSADPDNQYFSDGLAEELINALTRLPGLHVASRTSSFRFRGREADIREIGRDLKVGAVLEGSVRRAGTRLRVTAQLIDVGNGYHLWSERYDRELADVFAIQDEIVESIVQALAPALLGQAKAAVRRPTENLEAYELYLKGRHFWHLRTPGALQSAIRCFEQVIGLDDQYALAYAGLSDCLGICRAYGWFPAEPSRARAHAAVQRAMALDPSLAQVQFSQALHIFLFDRHWRGAEPFLIRAIAIDPRMVDALGYLGLACACDGRADEAQGHADHARAIDPQSAFTHFIAAIVLAVVGRFAEAEAAARRVLELQSDALSGLWTLGLALSGLERHDEAVAAMERAVVLSRAPYYVGLLGFVYGRAGRREAAMRLLGELAERADRGEYVIPVAKLTISVGVGDTAEVARALDACRDDSTPFSTIRITCGPFLERYRTDPAVARLLDAWSQ